MFDSIEKIYGEPLSKHSSFKIGGEAKAAYFPRSKEEFIFLLDKFSREGERFFVVGNGSNLLFDDLGFDGSVIFTKNMSECRYDYKADSVEVYAECGKKLTELSYDTGKKHALTGLEFAYGIPATVGGAVYMNAGAYGGQMADVVLDIEAYDIENERIVTIDNAGADFSYRHSIFEENKNLVVLSVRLKMKQGDPEQIAQIMDTNMQSRRDKQPLEFPSAGSTFKRPVGYFAAKLIDDAALKGYTVGGAKVSEKHAGFVINAGGATSADVLTLMSDVSRTVKEKFGVELSPEIIYLPYKEQE